MTTYYKKVGDYIFLKPIGHGAFAEVYKGYHQHTFQKVAIKMISRGKLSEQVRIIEKEILILKKLKHDNIVRMLDWQKTQNHYYLVFEFCKHGDFEHFIQQFYGGKVPEHDAQKYIQQIIEGIKAMKAKNIVHRDLKLANILVSKDFQLKIADFGLAQRLEGENFLLKTMAGTPLNMDPSILERKNYSDKCDIWSLGIIFYQILVGKLPYNPGKGGGIEDLLILIKRHPLAFPEDIHLSDSFKNLIRSMLVYDSNKRISFEELFNHDWITGKYKVFDPKTASNIPDLEASQLLQSVYTQKKVHEEHSKKEGERGNPVLKEEKKEKIPQAVPQNEVEEKIEDNSRLNRVQRKEISEELIGVTFLAKIFEMFRDKSYKLKDQLVKVRDIMNLEKGLDDEKLGVLKSLILIATLKLLKEVLLAKFKVYDEESGEIIFENTFKALWEMIMKNKAIIENIYSTEDATLEISDLFNQIQQDYIELFEQVNEKIETSKNSFERLSEMGVEKLILDCLIAISEKTAYDDYLDDDFRAMIERYMTCAQICEFLVFIRDFKFAEFCINQQNEGGNNENSIDEFVAPISQFFRNGFSFRLMKDLSQKEEFKKKFEQLKKSISIFDSDTPSCSRLDSSLKIFQGLLNRRLQDLKTKIEN